jgi:hypothetical protein
MPAGTAGRRVVPGRANARQEAGRPPGSPGTRDRCDTRELLAGLDAAATERALRRLRAALAAHDTGGGVFFDSRAWIITATLPGRAS